MILLYFISDEFQMFVVGISSVHFSFALWWLFLLSVAMAEAEGRGPRCDLTDVLQNDDLLHFTVNTKFIEPPDSRLPVMQPSGEVDVPKNISLIDMLQTVEHCESCWMLEWPG